MSSIFDPVVDESTTTCSRQNCNNKKESNDESCQPGPSRSMATAPAPPAGKGEESSVSESSAPANSGAMADDCAGSSSAPPEVKTSLEVGASESEKNAPIQFPKTYPVLRPTTKSFTEFTLGFHRYKMELIKKIRETTETIVQMKIKILRSFRAMVVLSENFSDEFKGFDEKNFPVLKEGLSAEEVAKIKKAYKNFFPLIRQYKELCNAYTQLNKAAGDAQQKFCVRWIEAMHKVGDEGYGLSSEDYHDLSRKNKDLAKRYETLVLFGGERDIRQKVASSQDGFIALINHHKQETIAAENFYEAIAKMLSGYYKQLNVGRGFEKKLYQMETKFRSQTEIMMWSVDEIKNDWFKLLQTTKLELDLLKQNEKCQEMVKERELQLEELEKEMKDLCKGSGE